MREEFSNTVSSAFERVLESGEGRLPPLRAVDLIPNSVPSRTFSSAELNDLKIIHPQMKQKAALNAFRELRTKILQLSEGRNFVLMVSSLGAASSVAANLAAAFALDKSKASLLIDCNLYEPSVCRLMTGEATSGLTEYLSDTKMVSEEIIYPSGILRVSLVPAGNNCEGAAEYFASQRMEKLIQEVKRRYVNRFVIIDAPSLLESAEARILSELSDFVVLAVPYGKVTEAQISSGIDAIPKEKLLGYIFNH
mgnify:CR=1 FL=1